MRHSISIGGVVINPEGKVLVVEQGGTSWSLPKGHIEKGESETEAAKREIYEESGLKDLKLIKKIGSYKRFQLKGNGRGEDKSILKTIIMYLFSTKETELKPVDVDSTNAVWIDKNMVAKKLTHPKDAEFFLSIKNQILKLI